MAVSIRTEELRKVYDSPPPLAAPGRGFAFSATPKQDRKQKFEVVALESLTLEVTAGEVYGLLGPNGAGKSTTVGILTTQIRPSSGRAWVGAHDVARDRVPVKKLIGVVPQRPNLDFSLTAREILTFHGAYFGIPAAERTERARALLESFQLTDRADQLVRGFSGGMMQRLSIARAMMHEPDILFMDEPSAGLDPQTRLLLWDLVRRYNARGKTVVLTTHNMDEADALCQRLAIIDHGKVIAKGSPAELKSSIPGGFLIRVQVQPQSEELSKKIRQLSGVTEVRSTGSNLLDVYADRGGPLVAEIVNLALSAGVNISDVHISEPSLENLFLHHTGRSLRD
jgi:ABC-2 type transport system ATP-binding protein